MDRCSNNGASSQRRDRVRREIVRRKQMQMAGRKGRKVAKQCVLPMFCGSGGSKSRLAQAPSSEPFGQMRDGKLHAVVARSTFPSQNAQNTSGSDRFWEERVCKDAFRVAGAVQETHESEMLGGQGADFLRRVAFWSIRSSSSRR